MGRTGTEINIITLLCFQKKHKSLFCLLLFQIKRLYLLLTVKESATDVPTNLEARRRIAFFTNSLFMDMPRAPRVRKMLSFRSNLYSLIFFRIHWCKSLWNLSFCKSWPVNWSTVFALQCYDTILQWGNCLFQKWPWDGEWRWCINHILSPKNLPRFHTLITFSFPHHHHSF